MGIDFSGYHQRSLALVVKEERIEESIIIDIKLFIGEQVVCDDVKTQRFAITYLDSTRFLLKPEIDIKEKIEDGVDTLVMRFSDQYIEENQKQNISLHIKHDDFASVMKYETDYNKALMRAKKEHKDIMLVLITNFCPWCRKFEQQVLLKPEINQIIQQRYIPVVLNREKDFYPKNLDRAFTPVIHFISYKTLSSYAQSIGYNEREKFEYFLKHVKY